MDKKCRKDHVDVEVKQAKEKIYEKKNHDRKKRMKEKWIFIALKFFGTESLDGLC